METFEKQRRKAFTLPQAKRIKELLDEGNSIYTVMAKMNVAQSSVLGVIAHYENLYATEHQLHQKAEKPPKMELVKAQRSADRWLQKQLA